MCVTVVEGDEVHATVDAGASGCGVYKSGASPLTVSCTVDLEEEI